MGGGLNKLLPIIFQIFFLLFLFLRHWQKAPPRVHLSRRTLGGVAKKLLKLCLFFLFLQPVAAGEELILAVVGPLSVLLFVLVIVLLYCFDTETSTLMNNLPKARVDEEMKIENHEVFYFL